MNFAQSHASHDVLRCTLHQVMVISAVQEPEGILKVYGSKNKQVRPDLRMSIPAKTKQLMQLIMELCTL